MKKLASFIVGVFCLSFGFAQNFDTVKVNTQEQVIQIGKNKITSKTSIEELTKIMGVATRIEKSSSGVERHFIYDELGITFSADPDGKFVDGIAVSYNHPNNKYAATGKYRKVFIIDNLTVNESVNVDDVKDKTKIKVLVPLSSSDWISNPRTITGMGIVVGYDSNSKITQIRLGFNPKA
jgi:hypothetical protein